MYYVIQRNTFREAHYDLLIDIMQKYGFDYEIVEFLPFVNELNFVTDRKDVFCFGAVRMAEEALKKGWYPGSLLNDNHDFDAYAPKFGYENMLNVDAVVIGLTDKVPFEDQHFFVKPNKDSKLFTGQLFSHDGWAEFAQGLMERNPTEKFVAASIKNIQLEVRCWVVGGKVVTASRYKLGTRVTYQNYDDETYIIDFAQSMVDKFQVAEAFVIDICLVADELKVIEVNVINAAGFYHANMFKLIDALENHFSPITA